MIEKRFIFNTEAEAKAFRDGIEYVNDSAVEVVEILERATEGQGLPEFTVFVRDEDARKDD